VEGVQAEYGDTASHRLSKALRQSD
jgi:hypothetical protein